VRVTIDDIVFPSPTEATFHYDIPVSTGRDRYPPDAGEF